MKKRRDDYQFLTGTATRGLLSGGWARLTGDDYVSPSERRLSREQTDELYPDDLGVLARQAIERVVATARQKLAAQRSRIGERLATVLQEMHNEYRGLHAVVDQNHPAGIPNPVNEHSEPEQDRLAEAV